MGAAESRGEGPHLCCRKRVIPPDCEASAKPSKQLFILSDNEGKKPRGPSVSAPCEEEETKKNAVKMCFEDLLKCYS